MERGPAGAWWRRDGLVVGAYVLASLLTTWPLATHLRGHVVSHGPREATAALNVWAMAWVAHQLPRDPVHLFDANSFHPYARTLAFSEHLLVPALLGAPVAAATGNWILAYNLLSLATLVVAAYGAYRLAFALTADRLAAFAAGLLYAFHSWNVNEMVRLQILSNAWFPFLLLALVRYFGAPRAAVAWAAALFYGLESLSCMYWALYAPLLVVLAAVVLQWSRRLPVRDLLRLAAPFLLPLAAVAVVLVPYVQASRELGLVRETPAPLPVERYLAVLPGNLLYGRLLPEGLPNEGAAHFPGFAAVGLAALGLWRGRPAAGVRPLLLVLAATGVLLSLGPRIVVGGVALGPGPYALVRALVPGFGNVRYPERFALFATLALAPALALGLTWVRRRVGTAAAASLAALVWVEHLAVPLSLDAIPGVAAAPEVYRALAARPDVTVVAEVPAARFRLERFDALPMYLSTAHWKRTVEGFSGYFPPTYAFTKWRLFHFPSEDSVAFLERFGVDTVIVRPDAPAALWEAGAARWTVEGPFAEGHRLLHLRAAPAPAFPPPAGRDPALVEIPRDGWRVQASSPGAALAVDDDPHTAWLDPIQEKGHFFRVGFPSPAVLSRISIGAGDPYRFPMRLRVLLQDAEGAWREVDVDERPAYDRLFAGLLHDPPRATLDLDVPAQTVLGFRLRIPETDPFWMPWALPEIRAYGPAVH